MRIGIEASRANKPQKTGVEWYAWHVIQELKKLSAHDPHAWTLYTHAPLMGGLERLQLHWTERRLSWPLPYGWTQGALSFDLWRHPVDAFFFPCSTLSRVIPKRTVVTVHDVGFRRHPELYKERQVRIHHAAMLENVRRAARILTVSQFSAHEISDLYHVDPARIIVTPNGIDHARYQPMVDRVDLTRRLDRLGMTKPYFLVIGRLEAKKNVVNVVHAFTRFVEQQGSRSDHELVLVGIPGYRVEEIRRVIETSSARDRIREIGYVAEADMPALLNGATALIHASWYEGFGLPPIQAMACGCPVIASFAGSLPEIIGNDNAFFFPPDQFEALAIQMDRVLTDSVTRERMRVAGLARAVKFTWQQTAALTYPALTEWK